MVGAAAIIAQCLGRVVAEKHRAGAVYPIEPRARFAQRQNQVFGCVAVTDREGFVQRRHRDQARMRQRLFRDLRTRSEEHTSELQSLMRISYAVFCLKKK